MYVCCVLSARVEHLEAAGGSTVASSCMTQTHFLWETDKCKSSNESTHWLRFAIKTQTNEQKQWRNTLSTFLFILLNRQYICRIKQVRLKFDLNGKQAVSFEISYAWLTEHTFFSFNTSDSYLVYVVSNCRNESSFLLIVCHLSCIVKKVSMN